MGGDPQKANALKQSLDYLDMYLDETEYVAGDELTIADFSLLATVTHLEGLDWSYKSYEKIQRWVTKLKTGLPYYNECNVAGIAMFKEWVKGRRRRRGRSCVAQEFQGLVRAFSAENCCIHHVVYFSTARCRKRSLIPLASYPTYSMSYHFDHFFFQFCCSEQRPSFVNTPAARWL